MFYKVIHFISNLALVKKWLDIHIILLQNKISKKGQRGVPHLKNLFQVFGRPKKRNFTYIIL